MTAQEAQAEIAKLHAQAAEHRALARTLRRDMAGLRRRPRGLQDPLRQLQLRSAADEQTRLAGRCIKDARALRANL